MNAFTIIIILYISSCLSQLNKQMAGPYDVNVYYLESCLKSPSPETMDINIKLKKMNRSSIGVSGFVAMGFPFNDEMSATVRLDQFTNGGWKENYFKQDFNKACSTVKKYVPNVLRRVLEAANIKPTTCPVPKGNYTFKNMILSVEVPEIPIFFYNKYKYICTAKIKGKTVACIQAEIDIIPKKTKRRG